MTDSQLPIAGATIVRVDVALTASFVAVATTAAVSFTPLARAVMVVTSLSLFAVGVSAFLWGYWSAVQRSRHDLIGVAALYFLSGDVAPPSVRRTMSLCLAIQCVVALGTALSRPETEGKPGSALAFGILVPMLGLGLNGLWGAWHGTFEPRSDARGEDPDRR